MVTKIRVLDLNRFFPKKKRLRPAREWLSSLSLQCPPGTPFDECVPRSIAILHFMEFGRWMLFESRSNNNCPFRGLLCRRVQKSMFVTSLLPCIHPVSRNRQMEAIGTGFWNTSELMLNFGGPKTGTFLLGGKISTIWLDSNYRVSCVGRLRLDRSTDIDFWILLHNSP